MLLQLCAAVPSSCIAQSHLCWHGLSSCRHCTAQIGQRHCPYRRIKWRPLQRSASNWKLNTQKNFSLKKKTRLHNSLAPCNFDTLSAAVKNLNPTNYENSFSCSHQWSLMLFVLWVRMARMPCGQYFSYLMTICLSLVSCSHFLLESFLKSTEML